MYFKNGLATDFFEMQLILIQKGLSFEYNLHFIWELLLDELTLHMVLLKTWGLICTNTGWFVPWCVGSASPHQTSCVCVATYLASDHH